MMNDEGQLERTGSCEEIFLTIMVNLIFKNKSIFSSNSSNTNKKSNSFYLTEKREGSEGRCYHRKTTGIKTGNEHLPYVMCDLHGLFG